MLIQPGSKLVLIGDSITDCGRTRPVAEGRGGGMGTGYPSLVNAMFTAQYPQHHIRVVNVGTSGNRVPDLAARWQSDVIDLQPDWLSILIGINDVWRHFDSPHQPECHVSIEAYREGLTSLLGQTRPLLKGLVLMGPYMIETNPLDPMRTMMIEYARVVQELAEKYDAIYVDLQSAFEVVLAHQHPYYIAQDRIHPELSGHMVIANEFMKAISGAGCHE